jgi:ADP-heptose:LPS heptosyltransferase
MNSNAYLEFYPTADERTEAARALAEAEESDAGYVAIHVGGGVNPGMRLLSKRWEPGRWARVADWLAETYEPNILLLGGPGKEDRQMADEVKAALFPATKPYVIDLVGKLGWGGLGAALERCGLFLGHDTGAMHLATAVRTPVVAVFGPSDPARYGPWDPSGRSVAVSAGAGRSDAGTLRRASDSAEIYHDAVSAEEVWAAVERVYAPALRREGVRV